MEGLVKTRLDKKERRKKARLAFKAKERQRKLEDVRIREEERFQRRKGLLVVKKPVRQDDVVRDEKQDSAPGTDIEEDDSKEQEIPIYPQNIHGGSVSADKLIRSKMVPGDCMYALFLLIKFRIQLKSLIVNFQRTNFRAH